MMRQDDRVIVVGAGPVGAVNALALVRKGIPVTLIEAEAEPPEDQRAATIHPPTVEMLAELGLRNEAFAEDASGGLLSPIFHFRDRVTGELVAVFDISLLEGEVPYPFVVQSQQYKLVRAAKPHLEASGIAEIRFSTKVTSLTQGADYVEVTLAGAERDSERLLGRYVIGADGGRSTVRRLSEIDFEGFTWPERFIKIGTSFDFGATDRGFCTRNYFSDPNEWLNLFKVKGNGPPGIWRGIMPIPADESDEQALSMDSIQRRLHCIHAKSGDYEIPYHALYSVHQRVAATFNNGRVLLAGDAAHINNPLGGMGMNGGIHDAMNLTARLVSAWHGPGNDLERYDRQRRLVTLEYIEKQSIQNKRNLESDGVEFGKNLRHIAADKSRTHDYL